MIQGATGLATAIGYVIRQMNKLELQRDNLRDRIMRLSIYQGTPNNLKNKRKFKKRMKQVLRSLKIIDKEIKKLKDESNKKV